MALFECFFGKAAIRHVMLVTNRWETVDCKVHEQALLKTFNEQAVLKTFFLPETSVEQFTGTAEDAHRILKSALEVRPKTRSDVVRGLPDLKSNPSPVRPTVSSQKQRRIWSLVLRLWRGGRRLLRPRRKASIDKDTTM
jgi:hypothetical protein